MFIFNPKTVLLPDGVHTRYDCQTLVMQEMSPEKKAIMQCVFGALPEGDDNHYAVRVERGQCLCSITKDEYDAMAADPGEVHVPIVEAPKVHWKTAQKAAKQAQG